MYPGGTLISALFGEPRSEYVPPRYPPDSGTGQKVEIGAGAEEAGIRHEGIQNERRRIVGERLRGGGGVEIEELQMGAALRAAFGPGADPVVSDAEIGPPGRFQKREAASPSGKYRFSPFAVDYL